MKKKKKNEEGGMGFCNILFEKKKKPQLFKKKKLFHKPGKGDFILFSAMDLCIICEKLHRLHIFPSCTLQSRQ